MKGFLIDTNVISELRKGSRCNSGVRNWFVECDDRLLYTSVLVVGEIRRGIELIRLRDPLSAQSLDAWFLRLRHSYGDRILAINEAICELWGECGLHQPVPPIDGLLAATALFHDLTIVSRNIDDFSNTAASLLNPFD